MLVYVVVQNNTGEVYNVYEDGNTAIQIAGHLNEELDSADTCTWKVAQRELIK